jgi:pimeloyl-ACP methyl ester carboxylesterase
MVRAAGPRGGVGRVAASPARDTRLLVNGARLEIDVRGGGEPMLVVPTALVADELLPITEQAVAAGVLQTVTYSRRGYAGSSPADAPGSIIRDAADAVGILDVLRIGRVHVVSLSFSGAIALEMASSFPGRVHSLTLIEPPPVHVPSAADFWTANARLQETRRRAGVSAALNEFMTLVMGEDWQTQMQRHLPGSVAQMERDAATFFDVDMTALSSWTYTAADAARIKAPVLYLGGTASNPWFAEERQLLLSWLPQTETTLIPGADHSLALSHAAEVAAEIAAFVQRHRIR